MSGHDEQDVRPVRGEGDLPKGDKNDEDGNQHAFIDNVVIARKYVGPISE